MLDFGLVLVGLGLYMCAGFAGFLGGLFCSLVSVGFVLVGLVDFGLFIKTLDKLGYDKRGLAWIWIVGFGLTFPFCAVVYWALDYPFDLISEVALGVYTFEGTMAYAWDASRLVISYLLVFVVIFTVLWVVQNSKAPPWGR